MKVSACIIIKSEAEWLREFFDKLSGLVDEWVVTDTGSTDESIQIAESVGATIKEFSWTGNFAEARNFCISHATGD